MRLKSLLDEYNAHGFNDCEVLQPDQVGIFMTCCTMDLEEKPPPEAEDLVAQDPVCRIMQGRMDICGVRATVPTMLWMSMLCKGNPGNAVIWAYTLCAIAEKKGNKVVTMDMLTMFFKNGFPTEDTKRKCWDAQKQKSGPGHTDNKMDTQSSWELGAEPEWEEVPA